jgi:hypothetical protein
VALANFMRLSSRERRTRNRVQRSVAGNPGRDDKERVAVPQRVETADAFYGQHISQCDN